MAAMCPVCGGAMGDETCSCTDCRTPAHPECFAYAGGCSIFGCGSIRALFPGSPAPADWRSDVPTGAGTGGWLIPHEAVGLPGASRVVRRALGDCRRYWRSCTQLEVLSLVGQTWLAVVCTGALATGLWDVSRWLAAAVVTVLSAHLNALASLLSLGISMRDAGLAWKDDPELRRPAAAAGRRARAIRGSRRLLRLAAVLAGAGILMGRASYPPIAAFMVVACVVFPYLSILPRWGIELAMLDAAAAPRIASAHAEDRAGRLGEHVPGGAAEDQLGHR
jgi:hypothetical protein